MRIGRGAIRICRSRTERGGGEYGRENAGISSENRVRIPVVECLRFPGEGLSSQGKGQQVDIPVPARDVI